MKTGGHCEKSYIVTGASKVTRVTSLQGSQTLARESVLTGPVDAGPDLTLATIRPCNHMTFITSRRSSDSLRPIHLGARPIMLFRPFQNLVVRCGFVFVIVWLTIIFPHGVIGKLIPHQNAPQIGMTFEANTVKVENFALLEFRAPPNKSEGRKDRARRAIAGPQPND